MFEVNNYSGHSSFLFLAFVGFSSFLLLLLLYKIVCVLVGGGFTVGIRKRAASLQKEHSIVIVIRVDRE